MVSRGGDHRAYPYVRSIPQRCSKYPYSTSLKLRHSQRNPADPKYGLSEYPCLLVACTVWREGLLCHYRTPRYRRVSDSGCRQFAEDIPANVHYLLLPVDKSRSQFPYNDGDYFQLERVLSIGEETEIQMVAMDNRIATEKQTPKGERESNE